MRQVGQAGSEMAGRVQPRAATIGLFAEADRWSVVRKRGAGCWALQVRARSEVGKLTAAIHRAEREKPVGR